ncbi:MAG: hypothetical protein N2256_07415 [Tepidimonas ignava]|jgi:F0F1-type ATP synthase assembly protein I|uniref:SdpI/YhfL family protein n=1 Tax=Tepidimonas ignava TaxID=114249 RepID=A0A4R3LIF8_9BURK|nr:hypothetical protein [Tepidimonas ignava]MCX7815304.1 hypothetical protein [Tepidimonas ignava]TCS99943.1 hypothetical protein EDC36_101217 [Tepidimonas ignava]TSE23328.1 hypothetical protein Tigna_00711 [Tepidimonas ignava]
MISVYPIKILFFLVLFPVAFFWLRRAWRIAVRRDFSEVALRKGEPPANAARWAPYELALNLVAGGVLVGVIVSVLMGWLAYEEWVAIAGSTLWVKIFLSFALGRHAHGIGLGRRVGRGKPAV